MPSPRSLLIVALAAAAVSAQAPPQPSFKSDTSAVMVDVVVRDKKGNPVIDLTASDFEVLEDGVPQTVASMTMVAPNGTANGETKSGTSSGPLPRTPAPPSPAPSQLASPAFTALVFDRLSPEARALSNDAARTFMSRLGEGDYVGIFVSDLALAPITPYTTDRPRLIKGLAEATTRPAASHDPEGLLPVVTSAESGGRTDLDAGASEVMEGTRNSWQRLAREQKGFATTNALLAVVRGLAVLPGRKAIIVFAERLAIPDAVSARLKELIAVANAANVTIYTVDAEGLRVHSADAETAQQIRAMGNAGLALKDDGSNGSSLAILESNEDVLRKDPRTSLQLLAEPTGGFLINNTNDLSRGIAAIDKDRRFHYLLTYTPKNQNYDGAWRALAVRVPSRQVQIRSRTGYLAVRGMTGIPLLSYEAPALAALNARPLPRQLPLKATALGLLSRNGEPRVAVIVSTDASAVTFTPNTANDAFVTDFTILARIKDAQGAVVRKTSEPYRLSGPIADLESARRGEVLFFRQPELPPGSYLLEAAVHDAIANAAGARFVPFTVYAAGPKGLLVSALVLVGRTEHVADVRPDDANPLLAGDVLLYPRLGEPYRKSADKAVPFFVRVKVAAGTPAPGASLVLVKNGQPAASVPLEFAAPNAQGVIDHLAQLPLDAFAVGDFVLRLVVQDGGESVTRETSVRVVQ